MPLQAQEWSNMLSDHPDRALVSYLLLGMEKGFHIGFNRAYDLKSAKSNMKSALLHPDVVRDYLEAERVRGTLLGPFLPADTKGVHINRFGVLEKKQAGKWRLIVDLSHPAKYSVNNGISPELCSLTYTKVDQVAQKILELGPGTEMGKIDVKSAYRIVPVHPADRHLLGMQWDGQVYVDAALPFGLRSAPKIFNALADALEWILKHKGVLHLWHYLDDFITIGSPGTEECKLFMDIMIETCRRLGVPLAECKMVGPVLCIVFLGIEINSVAMELRLPLEKLLRVKELVAEWLAKSPHKRWKKRELLSVAGHLQHAAVVVKPGRTFIRRLFDLAATVSSPDHHVRLTEAVRSDLAWWDQFLESWNGVSLLSMVDRPHTGPVVTSDASGSWGCGAFWGSSWFQLPWQSATGSEKENIATKEMIPVVIAAAVWGSKWKGASVLFCSNNQAVVAVMASRTSRDKALMHLLRCLFFLEAKHQFICRAEYISGVQNGLVDDLSRNRSDSFLQTMRGQANQQPTPVPKTLVDLLMSVKPDWCSQTWRQMFNTISSKD